MNSPHHDASTPEPSAAHAPAHAAVKPVRKRVVAAAAVVMLVLMLGLAELVLRLALPQSDFLSVDLKDDPKLDLVIPPHDRGHDALGFRNPKVPEQVDILAVGDSMTYGINTPYSGSWPAQAGAMLGRSVYNMGLGGFGPLQHLHVTRTLAPPLKAKVQVVAVYLGNDIMDVYGLTQKHEFWFPYRISKRVEGALTANDVIGERDAQEQLNDRKFAGLRDWLSMNSMLYSIVRNVALAPLIDSLGLRKTAAPAPEVMFPWRHPANPKSLLVFTSRVRALAMDPAQPEAAEGIAITHRAFAELRDAAHANGSKLLIAFIPTKERVYCPVLMREKVALPAHHLRVCEVEPQVTANLEAAARALGIATVQTAPGLEKAATEGALIYPPSADSHPIKAGYTIIARQIADAVKTLAP